jgi:hypothetical protein
LLVERNETIIEQAERDARARGAADERDRGPGDKVKDSHLALGGQDAGRGPPVVVAALLDRATGEESEIVGADPVGRSPATGGAVSCPTTK